MTANYSHAIFAMTDFFEPFSQHGPENAMDIEAAQGINMAKAAAQTKTLEHYVWSTLPHNSKLTGCKYVVPHSEAKNRIDDYIRSDASLAAKTTFFWITFYGNNFQYPVFTPNHFKTSGAYLQLSPAAPDTPVWSIGDPWISIGTFALAALKQPRLTRGKFVMAHVEETTTGQLLKDWSEVTGKPTHYVQTSLEEFSALWPMWGEEIGSMMAAWNELRDKSWSGEEGVLTGKDLGLSGKTYPGVKAAYARMDWEKLL